MTVAELIAKLQDMPQDHEAVVYSDVVTDYIPVTCVMHNQHVDKEIIIGSKDDEIAE